MLERPNTCDLALFISLFLDSVKLANVGNIYMQKDDDKIHEPLLCLSLQFSTHHVYPLTCLWVKPVTDDSSGL